MKKKILLVGLAVVLVALVVSFYFYEQEPKPKRVWLEYSDKYANSDRPVEDRKLYTEYELGQLPSTKGCMVLTHNRQKADYVVSIAVIQYVDGGLFYSSEAILSITKGNGDVVLVDYLTQDSNSTEDVGQQAITKMREVLCPTASR